MKKDNFANYHKSQFLLHTHYDVFIKLHTYDLLDELDCYIN